MNDGNELFQKNEGLMFYTIKKYFPFLTKDEDAIQTARIALWRASEHYKPYYAEFSTYAVKSIRRNLARYCTKERQYKKTVVFYSDERDDNSEFDESGRSFDFCLRIDDKELNEVEFNADCDTFYKQLTDEESQILRHLMSGYNQTEIAEVLKKDRRKIGVNVKTIGDKWKQNTKGRQ